MLFRCEKRWILSNPNVKTVVTKPTSSKVRTILRKIEMSQPKSTIDWRFRHEWGYVRMSSMRSRGRSHSDQRSQWMAQLWWWQFKQRRTNDFIPSRIQNERAWKYSRFTFFISSSVCFLNVFFPSTTGSQPRRWFVEHARRRCRADNAWLGRKHDIEIHTRIGRFFCHFEIVIPRESQSSWSNSMWMIRLQCQLYKREKHHTEAAELSANLCARLHANTAVRVRFRIVVVLSNLCASHFHFQINNDCVLIPLNSCEIVRTIAWSCTVLWMPKVSSGGAQPKPSWPRACWLPSSATNRQKPSNARHSHRIRCKILTASNL